jgi:hypothetical protein
LGFGGRGVGRGISGTVGATTVRHRRLELARGRLSRRIEGDRDPGGQDDDGGNDEKEAAAHAR